VIPGRFTQNNLILATLLLSDGEPHRATGTISGCFSCTPIKCVVDKNAAKSQRVMAAMLEMDKIDIAALEKVAMSR
jgi:hypothetical protein